ncbi:Gfo/Idh/MocA family protein [Acidicapsa acidisoli]|uniref:Gfo/Idh/MocA family protein n=1 Tax=Acidicapsa acidisoli TaxID=1615681 RepID=UPI0021DF614A|nr:Gfo/Idh/MocA family oxidoreductase [Acidicapsa acidisoli]
MDKTRREFLKTGAKTLALVTAAERLEAWRTPRTVLGASDRVRLGIIGLRGRGQEHIQRFGTLPNVEIAALCDIDDSVLREHLQVVQKMGFRPKTYTDVRKLLEDKSIDAVSIATPNHWHTLMSIWACQAGKDVYVEKPCSHNLWEGRQLVRAAAKYGRMVQHGTQSRSIPSVMQAVKQMQDGLLGDVYMARGLCYKWRDTIGRTPVSEVPAGVDYDLWTGPAPYQPFTKNHFHYNWHWFWNYGNGDIGNQGVHEVDIARWGLGLGFPNKISAIGGHFVFEDDQQTPNTLSCAFQYDLPDGKRKMIEFEVRHWMTNHEAEIGARANADARPKTAQAAAVPNCPHGGCGAQDLYPSYGGSGHENTVGDIFYGSKGYLAVDSVLGGYRTWMGREQKAGPSMPHRPEDQDHFGNFIACVISRKQEELRAPITEGHISAGLVHLANASYRLGRTLTFDPETQLVKDDDEANYLLRDGDRGYRAPFVVPEEV